MATIARPEPPAGSVIAPILQFPRRSHRERLKLQDAETRDTFRMPLPGVQRGGGERLDLGDVSGSAHRGDVSVNESSKRYPAERQCEAHHQQHRFWKHDPPPLNWQQRSAVEIVP